MNGSNTLPRISRRTILRFFFLCGGSAITAPFLGGCSTDPVTGEKSLVMMTRSQEIALDRKQAPFQFSADYGILMDRELNKYLNRVGMELARRSHRPDMPFSFRGVNAAHINAYAFPGGSIAATRGILVELQSEAELAALLGHEIGHVCARHAAEQMGKGLLVNLLVAGASIATSSAGHEGTAELISRLGGLGAGALLARYSRNDEREADALGMEYMTRAGYTPLGMAGLMEILLRSGEHNPTAIELMFATHPMSRERLETARLQAHERYASMLDNPDHRQRYMDHTAGLRRLKPAIRAIQKAETALARKQIRQAEELLHTALRHAPDDYQALVVMAKCQFMHHNHDEALSYARQATQVYPKEAQGHWLLAMSSLAKEKYDQALRELSEVDRLLPGNPDILFYRGQALEAMQRRDEAARAYAAFLEKVRQGDKAKYAYTRLREWGYIR
ncbi:M48 family metalloprotease [Desulfolithobacter sp.]